MVKMITLGFRDLIFGVSYFPRKFVVNKNTGLVTSS